MRKTAEWQLLLGALALPGCFVGAAIVNRIGRRNLSACSAHSSVEAPLTCPLPAVCCGFAGYLVIGLIVGCAYDKCARCRAFYSRAITENKTLQ